MVGFFLKTAFLGICSGLLFCSVAQAAENGKKEDPACLDSSNDEAEICELYVANVIHKYEKEFHPASERINKTCRAVEQTRLCYEGLMRRCADKPGIVAEFNRTVHGLEMFALPCNEPDVRRQEHLIDCYIPFLPEARGCSDVFDRTFYDYVLDQNYGGACGLIEELMGCYDDVEKHIHERCAEKGVKEFYRNNVIPFVGETSDFVLQHCDMPPKHKELFRRHSGSHHTIPDFATFATIMLAFWGIL